MKLFKPARSSFRSSTVRSPRVSRSSSRIPKLATMKNPVVKISIPKTKTSKTTKMGTIKV